MNDKLNKPVDRAKILFVEAEPWERGDLIHECSHGCEVIARPDRLEALDDAQVPDGVNVLSVFIHSRVSEEQLDRLPNLQFISTRSTGFDHIDLAACRRRKIIVSNVPHYGEDTVAEHAFALLLALTRKVHRCYERTIRGDFSLEGLRGIELHGKTFGALGVGSIGSRALAIAGGFGMRRIAYDIRQDAELAEKIGFEYVDFDRLLSESDALSLHVPYNDQTHHLLDAEALAKMKPGAFLINTARGGIIDPQALIDALKGGHLGGAALDVLEAENAIGEEAELLSSRYELDTLRSVVQNHTLLKLPNVIITPHVAFNSAEAVRRIIRTTTENIHTFLAGRPQNVVGGAA